MAAELVWVQIQNDIRFLFQLQLNEQSTAAREKHSTAQHRVKIEKQQRATRKTSLTVDCGIYSTIRNYYLKLNKNDG